MAAACACCRPRAPPVPPAVFDVTGVEVDGFKVVNGVGGQDDYVVFPLAVNLNGETYQTQKRFTDVEQLHKTLLPLLTGKEQRELKAILSPLTPVPLTSILNRMSGLYTVASNKDDPRWKREMGSREEGVRVYLAKVMQAYQRCVEAHSGDQSAWKRQLLAAAAAVGTVASGSSNIHLSVSRIQQQQQTQSLVGAEFEEWLKCDGERKKRGRKRERASSSVPQTHEIKRQFDSTEDLSPDANKIHRAGKYFVRAKNHLQSGQYGFSKRDYAVTLEELENVAAIPQALSVSLDIISCHSGMATALNALGSHLAAQQSAKAAIECYKTLDGETLGFIAFPQRGLIVRRLAADHSQACLALGDTFLLNEDEMKVSAADARRLIKRGIVKYKSLLEFDGGQTYQQVLSSCRTDTERSSVNCQWRTMQSLSVIVGSRAAIDCLQQRAEVDCRLSVAYIMFGKKVGQQVDAHDPKPAFQHALEHAYHARECLLQLHEGHEKVSHCLKAKVCNLLSDIHQQMQFADDSFAMEFCWCEATTFVANDIGFLQRDASLGKLINAVDVDHSVSPPFAFCKGIFQSRAGGFRNLALSALRLAPEDFTDSEKAEAHCSMGTFYFNQNEYEKAAEQLEQAKALYQTPGFCGIDVDDYLALRPNLCKKQKRMCFDLLVQCHFNLKDYASALVVSEQGHTRFLKEEMGRDRRKLDGGVTSTHGLGLKDADDAIKSFTEIQATVSRERAVTLVFSHVSATEDLIIAWVLDVEGQIQLCRALPLKTLASELKSVADNIITTPISLNSRGCSNECGTLIGEILQSLHEGRDAQRSPKAERVERLPSTLESVPEAFWSVLHHHLIQPVLGCIEECMGKAAADTHLLIVPDDWLHQVPWPGLFDVNTKKYLVERFPPRSVPSLTVLRLLQEHGNPARTMKELTSTPVIVGNPLSSSMPLPFGEEEGRQLCEVLKAHGMTTPVQLYQKNATVGLVKQEVVRASFLHMATHSDYSAFTLADGELIYCEIAKLPLNAMKFAVLPTCCSGRGEQSPDGPDGGLQRAFLVAGCPGLVVALSKVLDEETSQLMRLFYTGILNKGLDSCLALQQAMKQMIRWPGDAKGFRNPANWAVFMNVGLCTPKSAASDTISSVSKPKAEVQARFQVAVVVDIQVVDRDDTSEITCNIQVVDRDDTSENELSLEHSFSNTDSVASSHGTPASSTPGLTGRPENH